jgi:hypothetical protein
MGPRVVSQHDPFIRKCRESYYFVLYLSLGVVGGEVR